MKLFRRRILTILALVLYWPAIFVLTHIPAPARLIRINVSDKVLHFLAYFVLVFLLWFAINPNNKVNWRKPAVWWILFVVVWYGVFDEWLQGYVNRSPDVMDFLADLCGGVTALILLSIFNFWTASLIVTGGVLFVFTNLLRANPANLSAWPMLLFALLGYIFFTMLWIRWMYYFLPVKATQPRWLTGALSMPLGFLILTEIFSLVTAGNFAVINVIISAVGVMTVVLAVYLIPPLRRAIA